MCLLPTPNRNYLSEAYKKGIKEFDCGGCPECLRRRASSWALRAVAESHLHKRNCMITLTYDTFKYNSAHQVVGEEPVNPNIEVNVRDIQLFLKRLRKKFGPGIKYLCCAEYGNRTHRAHYHMLLFGVDFSDDAVFYKKSKRNSRIYRSSVLTKLWGLGICTVDCLNVKSSVARYCTKYCAKSRSDDTFMLASKSLGFEWLYQNFNGVSYFIEGKEYPIPRAIWQRYIVSKYPDVIMSPRYINYDPFDPFGLEKYQRGCQLRKYYRETRDNDEEYINYIQYWSFKQYLFSLTRPSARERIEALPDDKYHNYKRAALECYDKRKKYNVCYPAPCSGMRSTWLRDIERCQYNSGIRGYFALASCPKRANDTNYSRSFENEYISPFGDVLDTREFRPLQLIYEQLKLPECPEYVQNAQE
ncbi:replication initiator protein [Dipodfec virus UA23Rod_1125]|uniref:Replication initiator protein n=1 Tax=Dipodfec virus UA23Rod_1125 TaxID=2929328 RepID=A0A976N1R5_9VIRU|nr:replication initiator protein [Dipodfec virus UA23Rod_1125]